MPIFLAPPHSSVDKRLEAIEKALRHVAVLADGALQIPPQMRSGIPGAALSGGQPIFDSQGLVSVLQVIVNGGTQTGGPIAGVAAPPTGLSGVGGEVALTTATFTLPRKETVMMLAICTDYVLCTAAFTATHPVYFQVDGTDDTTAYGYVAVWANPGNAETRAHSTTILKVSALAGGSHTVKVIWNSMEGATDTIFNANNPLFVFQLGN